MRISKLLSLSAVIVGLYFISSSAEAGTTTDAKVFIKKASIANQFEIDSSKMALDKSHNDQVKQFAQHMIDDHTKAGSDMQAAVEKSGQDKSLIRDTLDSKHQKKLDKLQKDSDKDFDKDYVSAQLDAHKYAVKLFEKYSEKGDDATLKDFAAKTLPTLEHHQEMIESIKKSM